MELLAPAGNLEKLKTAIRFGADAVYCGAGSFSLRAPETSFSLNSLAEGVRFAHDHGCRVYVAMNIFAFDEDFTEMMAYFKEAEKMGIDAVIVSDPGVILGIRDLGSKIKIHLSTQSNTTNSESARFWQKQGVGRIVAARELSLAGVKAMKEKVPGLELETFVHGAMCVAYSGRCLLSSVLNDRSANRGHCSQPCRWEYRLTEEISGVAQTIQEDARGTYILNSRDLCMIEHIPLLAAAGVDSLKIEGRMKTAYYVAAVTRVYRAALDSFYKLGQDYRYLPQWLDELKKVSHRPYTTGFYLPDRAVDTEYTADSSYIRGYDFVGTVDEHNLESNTLRIKARNRFSVGDLLEVLDPHYKDVYEVRVSYIRDERTGSNLNEAHNSYIVTIPFAAGSSFKISEHALVRRKHDGGM